MNFSHFFIRRPIFAAVLSIVIVLVGGIAMFQLPIAQYPEIVPPTVVVRAVYPGANPKVLAETVATPIEQEVNGVENMLYMSSTSTSDGVMTLTITFKLGTDLNTAQVLVQNRVAIALPKLPEEVRRLGVTTTKRSTDLTMVAHLVSPDDSRDELYLGNYAFLQVKDQLARIPGVGEVTVFGARDYSMRIWLDPEKLASRNMTAGDVVRAIREQNLQVAAGTIGQPPVPAGQRFSTHHQHARAAARRTAVRRHHRQARGARPGHARPRRGASRTGRARLLRCLATQRQARRRARHLGNCRDRTPSKPPTPCGPSWRN